MSSLEALSVFKVEIDIVHNIIKGYTNLTNTGKTIVLCWLPSHVNICGNERADSAAKSALSLPIMNMKLPAYELIPSVSKFCLNEWEDIWDCCKGNKVRSIYPTVGIVLETLHKTLSSVVNLKISLIVNQIRSLL